MPCAACDVVVEDVRLAMLPGRGAPLFLCAECDHMVYQYKAAFTRWHQQMDEQGWDAGVGLLALLRDMAAKFRETGYPHQVAERYVREVSLAFWPKACRKARDANSERAELDAFMAPLSAHAGVREPR